MKVQEVLRLLHEDGWKVVAVRGSHRQLKHPEKRGRVTVAGKPSDDLAPRDPKQHPETGRTEMSRAMRYAVVIERAGANYSAYAPDLPGCVATGATEQEVEDLLREAIEMHLSGMREDNLPIPEPTSRVDYLEVEVRA